MVKERKVNTYVGVLSGKELLFSFRVSREKTGPEEKYTEFLLMKYFIQMHKRLSEPAVCCRIKCLLNHKRDLL
jgi:hypothetical protein